MGCYLCVGIVRKMGFAKDSFSKLSEEKQQSFLKSFGFPQTYDFETGEKYCYLNLKTDVVKSEMVLFLEKQVQYYGNVDDPLNFEDLIEKIRSCETGEEILEIAAEKEFYNFQLDDYHSENYRMEGIKIQVHFETIMLFLEGKIEMESYGRMFKYFEQALHKVFSKFALAKSLKIFITD